MQLHPYSNKTVFFGKTVEDPKHVYRQMVGYLAGFGTQRIDEWKDKIDFLVYQDLTTDLTEIIDFLVAEGIPTKKIEKVTKLSLSEFLHSVKDWHFPEGFYIKN